MPCFRHILVTSLTSGIMTESGACGGLWATQAEVVIAAAGQIGAGRLLLYDCCTWANLMWSQMAILYNFNGVRHPTVKEKNFQVVTYFHFIWRIVLFLFYIFFSIHGLIDQFQATLNKQNQIFSHRMFLENQLNNYSNSACLHGCHSGRSTSV